MEDVVRNREMGERYMLFKELLEEEKAEFIAARQTRRYFAHTAFRSLENLCRKIV